MKFNLDENFPVEIEGDLRQLGYDVETVCSEGLSGATDIRLVQICKAENRILLTLDKGIPILNPQSGVALFRPNTNGREAVVRFVREHLPDRKSVV